ncbi:MAG: carboxymuconolactone decarboxylase family protein [Candidatus Xenobia bacterium]
MQDRVARGREKGRALLGAARWDRVEQGLRQVDGELTDALMSTAYGEVFCRPGLDDRTREVVAITCLTMLGLEPQLQTHLIAARKAGLSEAELREVFLTIAMYAGFPTALCGATAAQKVREKE